MCWSASRTNVHDEHPLPDLLHGREERVYGDSAYASQYKLIESKAPGAKDCKNQRIREGSATEHLDRILNRVKSRVRSRVEHVFAVIKRLWGCGDSTRCATGVWRRTPRGRLWPRGWPTSTWHASASLHECVCSAHDTCRSAVIRPHLRANPFERPTLLAHCEIDRTQALKLEPCSALP